MPFLILVVGLGGLWFIALDNIKPKPEGVSESFSEWSARLWDVIGVAILSVLVEAGGVTALIYDHRHPTVCVKSHVVVHDATECWSVPLVYKHCEPVKTEETVCDEKVQK